MLFRAEGFDVSIAQIIAVDEDDIRRTLLLGKRASITGSVLRSRPLEEKAALAQSFSKAVLPLFESEKLMPVVDRMMPMEEIGAAHEYMESNASFGKLVMTW